MFSEPIETIEQAKEIFLSVNGSPFHMAREFPQRYSEYRQLNIAPQTELEWREELLTGQFKEIKETEDPKQLWIIYSRMCDVFVDLKTETALQTMLEAASSIRDKVPKKERVIVAEMIIGRNARETRQGLIYTAYDMGNIPAAKAFVELALHFSASGGQRSQEARALCNDIKLELGL